jgi:CheY-like chemotaxis protein
MLGAAAVAVIPEKKLVRVLVIDDEVSFQEDMIDYFNDYGYAVDVARDPTLAIELLKLNKYQIVLVDVNFTGIEIKGDSFVLKNHEYFKGARVVVVTGRNINTMRYRRALENLKIPIWDKGGENWGRDLTGLTEEATKARKQEITGRVNDFLSSELGDTGNYVMTGASAAAAAVAPQPEEAPTLERWAVQTKGIFFEWLESQSDPERPLLLIGHQVLSARSMIEHVKEGTELGNELLERFATEVRYSMGIGNKPISRS